MPAASGIEHDPGGLNTELNFNYIGTIKRGEKVASLYTVARLARTVFSGCLIL